jgi:hypothetical protein
MECSKLAFSDHPMSTAAELLEPQAFASIKAEFHDLFLQKREEVRKLRAAVRVSRSAQSERDGHQAANENGTGSKRSREMAERPIRPLKRPRIHEDVPKSSSGAGRDRWNREHWENHTFAELSPTGQRQALHKVRVKEEIYEPLRKWKAVERGMATYEYVFAQGYDPHSQNAPIASINSTKYVKLIASGLATFGLHCLIALKRLLSNT